MAKNYILIDYENVKLNNLDLLAGHPFDVMIFVGSSQTKLPTELVQQLLELPAVECIRISGNGRNALDFHIAYYLGKLMAEGKPKTYFHIVSKDQGFDPLLDHLKVNKKVKAYRANDLSEILPLRIPKSATDETKMNAIIKNLAGRGSSKPRRVKTLRNTIRSLFEEEIGARQLDSIVEKLTTREHVVINEERVSYNFPK